MKIWIDKVWGRRKGILLKKKAHLAFDHLAFEVLHQAKIPTMQCCTGYYTRKINITLQPLDVLLNKPLKMYMIEKWNK